MTWHNILKLLCFEFRVVSVEYFLDVMQEYEVKAYLEYIPYLDRNSWEQCRYEIYSKVQMNSSKQINAQDLIRFPWDESTISTDTAISNDDIERLKNKSKLIQEKYYNNECSKIYS